MMNENKNKVLYSMAVVLLIVAIALSCFLVYFFPTAAASSTTQQQTVSSTDSSAGLNIEMGDHDDQMLLAVSAATETATSIDYTITATVLPTDAKHKEIDWSVSWGTALSDSAVVTDYVTVTPDSDGSLTATISCIKAFEGATVIVTAQCRYANVSATATCNYIGAPTSISFASITGLTQLTDGTYEVEAGDTFSFTYALDNILHSVGSVFPITFYKALATYMFAGSMTLILTSEDNGTFTYVLSFDENTWYMDDYYVSDPVSTVFPTMYWLLQNMLYLTTFSLQPATTTGTSSFHCNLESLVETTWTETITTSNLSAAEELGRKIPIAADTYKITITDVSDLSVKLVPCYNYLHSLYDSNDTSKSYIFSTENAITVIPISSVTSVSVSSDTIYI